MLEGGVLKTPPTIKAEKKMNDVIECLACKDAGAKYSAYMLTHTHLMNEHGLTTKQYKDKYNVRYVQSELAIHEATKQAKENWSNKEIVDKINKNRKEASIASTGTLMFKFQIH